MARYGGGVPWHRVVTADGRLPLGHEARASRLLAAEGTPMRGDRVDMAAAAWYPDPSRPLSVPCRPARASAGPREQVRGTCWVGGAGTPKFGEFELTMRV